jgi:aldehyde:ferredoxin oxidoreductase
VPRLIRVNMKELRVSEEELPSEFTMLGGRALTSLLIATEIPPSCHPLGPSNKLIIAPGLLTGSGAANASRLSIGAKSPLTNGIKESNVGGTVGTKLAKLGVGALVIEDQPDDGHLYCLHVKADGVEIAPADDYHGLSIGPAGEMMMSSASIAGTSTNGFPSRHAGRGGLGAVMGSKGLKYIVFHEAAGRAAAAMHDAQSFLTHVVEWRSLVNDHPITEALRVYGTPNTAGAIDAVGDYPTRNFSAGHFEGIERIHGPAVHDLIKARGGKVTHAGCSSCIIQCSNEFVDAHGQYVTSAFEYETIWANGANCGIDDIDALATMDRLLDDYGLDSMETGCAIAVAMEAGVREFGDAAGAIELIREIGAGTSLGRILGNGAAMVGKAFGIRRVPVVKGQAMAGYDPRALLGQGVGYATSPMGADHTACFAPAQSIFGVGEYIDPLSAEGQVEYARALQLEAAMLDALGFCQFVDFPLAGRRDEGLALITGMVNAKLGTDLVPSQVVGMGDMILRTELAFNEAAGLTRQSDRLPEFFLTEKLPPHDVVFTIPDEKLDDVFSSLR